MKRNNNNLISVIIPAHNEEKVIVRCLTSLLQGLNFEEAEIIVICNGCTDHTAKRVQSISRDIQLIETPLASKTNALNLGNECSKGYPKIYLDADIKVGGHDIKKLAQKLKAGHFLAASPVLKVEYEGSPWLIRSFYGIWCRLPFVTQGTIGCGIYGLSKVGRERFDKFPEITADDSFIRFLFSPSERGVVGNSIFTIFPPTCLSDLLKIRIRQCFGHYEFKKKFPELAAQHPETNIGQPFFSLFKIMSLWPALLVYIGINIFSQIGGRCKFWFGNKKYWNRDESSRF